MHVTIVIATYNEGMLLSRTIEATADSASGLDYDILVADDASTDGSVDLARQRFPSLNVVRHTQRQGVAPTKALGARHASGDMLVFLDSHTKPEGDAIAKLVHDVEALDGKAIVTPAIATLNTQDWTNDLNQLGHGYSIDLAILDTQWKNLDELRVVTVGERKFYESPVLIGCAFAISRSLHDKLWGFDASMHWWGVEDLDLGLKCWLMGHQILHDPRAIVGHRFRKIFGTSAIPVEHMLVNQIRMARKNLTEPVWVQWMERCRQRSQAPLPNYPEGLWAHAWSLFQEDQSSVEQERAYLQKERVHDEFWYAMRFGLSWPHLQPSSALQKDATPDSRIEPNHDRDVALDATVGTTQREQAPTTDHPHNVSNPNAAAQVLSQNPTGLQMPTKAFPLWNPVPLSLIPAEVLPPGLLSPTIPSGEQSTDAIPGDRSPRESVQPAARYHRANDLCVIVCYFNSQGYASIKRNYEIFRQSMLDSGIHLITVECAFGDTAFELGNTPDVMRFRSKHLLWQKERLLNLAVPRVPKRYTKIAWLDCDILFENASWAEETSHLLEKYPLVQPFDCSFSLRPGERSYCGKGDRTRGFAALHATFPLMITRATMYFEHGHAGYAWAARRDILEDIGLYDVVLSGTADHLMAHAFCNDLDSPCLYSTFVNASSYQAHYRAWAKAAWEKVRGQIGFVSGAALHMWHGESRNRQYDQNSFHVASLGYDPALDLSTQDNGLWQWSGHNPALAEWAQSSFAKRQEDTSGHHITEG